jgi:RNA polymerase sigma-70 factor (ECF subfamily)
MTRSAARDTPDPMLSAAVAMTDASDAVGPEATLIARCRRGEPAAQRELYVAHAPRVMHYARRLGMPPEEAEDVAQEVFLTAFDEIDRAPADALVPWLFRITSHRAHDRHRRRRVRETFARLFGMADEERDRGPDPEGALLRRDAEERVARILGRMTRKKREVFVLFELEELSGEAIAKQLGIPVDTVWTRLHHARKDFAKLGRALELMEQLRPPRGVR